MAVDIQKVRIFLDKKNNTARKKNINLWEKANAEFSLVIAMLKRDYKLKRIWSWGSLLKSENFREYSDIDIAIEGLDADSDLNSNQPKEVAQIFFELYGKASDLCTFPLDLVELDKMNPNFAAIIRMKGKIIYERP